ncbi:MAG: hypothetical protein ACM3XR_03790 [Bacillota bacterium]
MRKETIVKKYICIAYMAFLAAVLVLPSGCNQTGRQQEYQMQAQKKEQEQEEEPEKLKKLESQLEDLFETLGGPSVKKEKGESKEEQDTHQQQDTEQKRTQQQGTQQQDTRQQGTQQQGKQEDTQQQGMQQQGTQQQGTQKQDVKKQGAQPPQEEKWSEVDKIINKLHYQWNDLVPELTKKVADMKLVDNFDNALNSLTTTAASRNAQNVLTSANALYSYMPDLFSLYRGKVSPEIKRMIYYIRNIIMESSKDNWETVKKDAESLEKSWSLFRNTLEKEQQQISDKLNFSIYELKKVASGKEKQLTSIKGMIALNNIKELQMSLEENK